jgi:succinoglycan biosynthesis protein ExoL
MVCSSPDAMHDETMRADAPGRGLIFFAPDIADPSTITRVQEFCDYGFSPVVFGFRRNRFNPGYRPPWPYVQLGQTTDGRYGRRLRTFLAKLPVLIASRRHLRGPAVLYARNIDQLGLAYIARMFFNRSAALAYEVLDIQPAFTGRGPVSIVLRMIERVLLRSVKLLVISSPAFYWNYYAARQGYAGRWFLLENKLHHSALAHVPKIRTLPETPSRQQGYRWAVGYFGLIRGQATFDLITRIAARLTGRVLFRFRGILTTVDRDKFVSALQINKNMVYEGDYRHPDDLARLYGSVDFAWALDLENAEHNSRWLLPCRFYEAGLFGVPCLAIRNFEVGSLIDRMGVGWVMEEPLEEAVVRFFERLTPEDYREKRRRLLELPQSTFIAEDDAARMCDVLWELGRLGAETPHAPPTARTMPAESLTAVGTPLLQPRSSSAVAHDAVKLD